MTDKAPSEWQYVPYRCTDCGRTGECATRIGEFAFCGQCGSTFLEKLKETKPCQEPEDPTKPLAQPAPPAS